MSEQSIGKNDDSHVTLEHAAKLYSYARRLCREKADAEDLVQETYLRAIRASSKLAPDSNVKGWMYTIMQNVHFNRVRSIRNAPAVVEIDAQDANQQSWIDTSADYPHACFVRAATSARIREAVSSLPIHYQEVIVMREFHDMSYRQIALKLKCPIGTVMSRLRRARERLRPLLEEGYCYSGRKSNNGNKPSHRDDNE